MSRGSMLPEGMTLAGEIRGQGDLIVAGTVEGPIAIDGHLTIEASGSVRGEVKARALVLRGTLAGPAIAEETIRLEPGARMVGDARAERVSVVEGALLRGRITMTGAQRAEGARRSSAGQLAAEDARTQGRGAELGSAAGAQGRGSEVASAAGAPGRVADVARAAGTQGRVADVASAAGIAPRGASGVLVAPRERPRAPDAPAAPPAAAGAAPPAAPGPVAEGAPRSAAALEDVDGRPTGRFVRRDGASVPAPTEGSRVRPDRRPPEPVIPGVGRQRARRKDGGLAT